MAYKLYSVHLLTVVWVIQRSLHCLDLHIQQTGASLITLGLLKGTVAAETPTALSGQEHSKSQLVAAFYDVFTHSQYYLVVGRVSHSFPVNIIYRVVDSSRNVNPSGGQQGQISPARTCRIGLA